MLTGALSTLYRYARRAVPGPGSENLAFLDEWLPFQTPIGPGQANHRQIITYPAGLANQRVMMSSPLPGLPASQWFLSPLGTPPS